MIKFKKYMKKHLLSIGVIIILAMLILSSAHFSINKRSSDKEEPQTATTTSDKIISNEPFSSEILGISWVMPTLSGFTEGITPKQTTDKTPPDTWYLSGSDAGYVIRPTNSKIALSNYEGSFVMKYAGEKLDSICDGGIFNEIDYKTKISSCELRTNPNGVQYALFDAEYEYVGTYGFMDRIIGTKIAHAESKPFRIVGAVFQTRSNKFPGLSFYRVTRSDEDQGKIESIKKEIQTAIDSLQYTRDSWK